MSEREGAGWHVATAGVRPRRRRRGLLEPIVVTALYDTREGVEAVVRRLRDAGVPRDLIEIVVSRGAAERFYPGSARLTGRDVFRYAGIGGLTGLIVSALVSLGILALPGQAAPGITAIVQLLGPDIGAVGGALAGAVYGAFRRRRPNRRHARAAEIPSAILLSVRTRTEEEALALEQVLAGGGGREIRIEE